MNLHAAEPLGGTHLAPQKGKERGPVRSCRAFEGPRALRERPAARGLRGSSSRREHDVRRKRVGARPASVNCGRLASAPPPHSGSIPAASSTCSRGPADAPTLTPELWCSLSRPRDFRWALGRCAAVAGNSPLALPTSDPANARGFLTKRRPGYWRYVPKLARDPPC